MEGPSPRPSLPPTHSSCSQLACLVPGYRFRSVIATSAMLWPRLVASQDVMPHAYCCRWNTNLSRLHVISDALIFLSYLPIPFPLPSYFARGRRDMLSNGMFLQFGKFIVAWGST